MFKIIVASYNCIEEIGTCLRSILDQVEVEFEVVVVDDASPDDGKQAAFIKNWCETLSRRGGDWHHIIHTENKGALYSQVEAIRSLKCEDDDVIVFLDGDDQFIRPRVLKTVAEVYDANPKLLMTYGNYTPLPPDPGCPKPFNYPLECREENDYRNAGKWGIGFNHLRTVKYEVFKHLTDEDFLDEDGSWYHVAGDTAVMIPCLELSGGSYQFIKEPLVYYTSDSPQADWRLNADEIDRIHARIFSQPKKEALYG